MLSLVEEQDVEMVAAMKPVVGRSGNCVHMQRQDSCDSEGEVAGVRSRSGIQQQTSVCHQDRMLAGGQDTEAKVGEVSDRGAAQWEEGKDAAAATASGADEEVTI